MKLPKWINRALRNELKVIQNILRGTGKKSDLKALEFVIYSDFCKDLWENSNQLTTAELDGQVWLAHAILKALAVLSENKTEAELWRYDVIQTAKILSKKLRNRPKEKLVSECESTAKQLDNLVKNIKKKFKTTKFAARPRRKTPESTGEYAYKQNLTKGLIREYLKRDYCFPNKKLVEEVTLIVNTIGNHTGRFEDIDPNSVEKMIESVKTVLPESTSGAALIIKFKPE